MEVLHICSYYIGNTLYANLVKELSKDQVNQHVFIPIKNESFEGINQLPSEYNTIKYYYNNILNKHDRFFYFNKTRKQLHEIERLIISKRNISFIHAHTLFSDGGTAYRLYRRHGINYAINVRNTDVNIFYKYCIHLRPFMYKILLSASFIVFISPAYKEKVLKVLPERIKNEISGKCLTIPNGIDDFWHKNQISPKGKYIKHKKVTLIFVGNLDKNKNIESVLYSCYELKNKGYDVRLNVIGKGPLDNYCRELTNDLKITDQVIFHGYISNKEKISSIMKVSDIFIMPSVNETFGIVYIEALSMGLPVIYSKDQGIDGYFRSGEVGYPIEPNNIKDITNAVFKILDNYPDISRKCASKITSFNWSTITKKYKGLYLKGSVEQKT
ncbi:glycosyltransferase family 4 protein [Halobacillus litoralis]|uniref:glycosyltransferase family 4 protein n=1 Tax=Halobacillus litoralis TaxID=45668 RepID=UPI001CD4129A|nr:glycosyltransferase family 4 protein [Halobacillus litoralis]MCA0970936.1 glycosyltransferase family 4 protein [Halobacillus litoralis]